MKFKLPLQSDATVSYDDATDVLRQTVGKTGQDMLNELIHQEPAVVAIAISAARQLGRRLTRHGLPPESIFYFTSMALHMQAVVMQLHLTGSRKLWADMIEPEEAGEK